MTGLNGTEKRSAGPEIDPGASRHAVIPDARLRTAQGLAAEFRRVLVLGASRSGIAAAVALCRLGRLVTLSDHKPRESLPGVEEALEAGAQLVSEAVLEEYWPGFDLVVKSPGIPAEAALVRKARERGVPVWSELELAYVLLPNPFLAVTGTNGKTTTTALLGHLLQTAGIPVRVLGNIGVAATSVAGSVGAEEELVVEVSSFQLEDTHRFRPAVGVFLNLTPDHLDRHGSMQRYLECKAKLFANQGPEDVAVLNLADRAVASVGRDLAAKPGGPQVKYFAVRPSALLGDEAGATPAKQGKGYGRGATGLASSLLDSWVEAGCFVLDRQPLLEISHIRLPGSHNLENCLAAATAASARGVERQAIAEGLRTFTGVPHRLERVAVVSGVTYVNDSKATNVDAALTALNAFPERTHLILGGRDKASDYSPLVRRSAAACKGVYLIGEAAPLITQAFAEAKGRDDRKSWPELHQCGDLERAVYLAASLAEPGDVVLLAPACASFDQYRNYEERGEHFRSLVLALAKERT